MPAQRWHDPEVGFAGLGRELAGVGATGKQTRLTVGELVAPVAGASMLESLAPVHQFIAQQTAPMQSWVGVHAAMRDILAPPHRTATFGAVQQMLRPSPLLGLNLGRYLTGAFDLDMGWVDQLYPSGSILTSVLRPIDLVTPALPDMSAMFKNFVDTTSIFEGLWRDVELWRRLADTGSAVAMRAVRDAWYAALRQGPEALAWFVRDWLDRKPTGPRLDAARDVLLHLDWDELPGDGIAALAYLRARMRQRYRATRSLLDTKLRGGLIIAADADPTNELPVTAPGPGLETSVLELVEPITDPRLHAILQALTAEDQRIVLLKASTGCGWAVAAEMSGRARGYGEVLRRRLIRRRTALGLT